MPVVRYGTSPWLDRAPKNRRPSYPAFRGTLDVPIAIVGGGLAGCATAYALSAAGLRVALVDADRLAAGATALASGLLMAAPGIDYQQLERLHGRRVARALWQDTRRAALDAQATLRRLRIRCAIKPADAIVWGASPEAGKQLRRELNALRAAGMDASWVAPRGLAQAAGVTGVGGLKTRGHASLDPYAAAIGLARAAAQRGAAVFERSPVTRLRQGRRAVELTVGAGLLRAETVIVATGTARPLFPALARHFAELESYAVLTPPLSAAVRKQAGARRAILEDKSAPPHRLAWTGDDRILWTGAGQAAQPERQRKTVLVQRTGQLMYELSLVLPAISGIQPAYGWHSPSSHTADHLPFIGTHRNYPRHLFALGLGNTLTAAFLAGRLLSRACQDRLETADAYFGFDRIAGRR